MHESDIRLLREAYFEALKATGNSDPNPAVGAIVTDESGNILARGATQRAGFAHAERMALQDTNADFGGKTLYVTLEPCCHHGRTPPCTDIIREKRIGRVVVGERDFATEVMGKSVELLRQSGIVVEILPEDLLSTEKLFTTGPFFLARRLKRPRLVLKWAETSDGSLAPQEGPSGKISGEPAAAITAALRNYCKFTLSSPGTVQIDRPRLDVRFPEKPVDLSGTGFSDFFSELIATQLKPPSATDMATSYKHPARGYLTYPLSAAARTAITDFQKNVAPDFIFFERPATDLRAAFRNTMESVLGEILANGFNSVLVEAGPRFSQSLIDAGLVDILVVYHSKTRSAADLWAAPGRGNTASALIAQATDNNPQLPGFTLLERGDLGSDVVYVFKRLADA